MQYARILIHALAIVAPAGAVVKIPQGIITGCTRICSAVNKDRLVLEPHCHQRCQADVYNCIEGTLPHEEAQGERATCIQEALLTRIKEDGGIITKLTYDVAPNFEQFDELYNKDGRFDSRDMAVLKKIMSKEGEILFGIIKEGQTGAADGGKLSQEKVKVVKSVFKEADQDGDGVVTEGEFNAFAEGTDVLAAKEIDIGDLPDFLARDKKASPQNKELKKMKKTKLSYFQHLLHLGLTVIREEENRTDPIAALAATMYKDKAPGSKIKQSL